MVRNINSFLGGRGAGNKNMKEETGIHGGVAIRRPTNFTGKDKRLSTERKRAFKS